MSRTAVTPELIVVTGVPGSGKSTVLRAVTERTDLSGAVRVLDPEHRRETIARRLPERTPYRWYRALVHLSHRCALLALLARGPGSSASGSSDDVPTLLVHEPGTRAWLLRAIRVLAARRGWSVRLLMIDVEREQALDGQRSRRRMVPTRAFHRHWHRWRRLREVWRETGRPPGGPGWDRVVLVPRELAFEALLAELPARHPRARTARRSVGQAVGRTAGQAAGASTAAARVAATSSSITAATAARAASSTSTVPSKAA